MMMEGAEWSSINGANSVKEEADFMAQLFPNCSLDSDNDIQSSDAPLSSSCYSGITLIEGDNGSYLGSSSYSGNSGCISLPFQGTYSLSDAYEFFPVEYCPIVSKLYAQHLPGNLLMERSERLSLEMSSGNQGPKFSDNISLQLNHECDQMSENDPVSEDLSESGRKRCRISEKGKRYIRTKKNQKIGSENDEDNNRQNSSSCSEEECNGSQELKGNGKTRASRGTATDPQSLYARKRRERINERLKILQNLVPNGTKVDISTMLEEAVSYVKFMQLQIKEK